MQLSIVSPVYKSELTLNALVQSLHSALNDISLQYEIILVDDRSPDKSWATINSLAAKFSEVRGIRLSRNFGQHAAITAGLQSAQGQWIVVMDCDLEDNPAHIPLLLKEVQNGYDAVLVCRVNRQHSQLKQLMSTLFYLVFSYLAGFNYNKSIGNFGVYSQKLICAVLSMGDSQKYFPAQVQWVGFKQKQIKLPHQGRYAGKSSYNLKKLLYLALNNILTFSEKPLRIIALFGLFVSGSSFFLGIVYLIVGLLGLVKVSGFISIIVGLFFSTGSIILVLGIIGLYLGKNFEASKQRPTFVVDQMI